MYELSFFSLFPRPQSSIPVVDIFDFDKGRYLRKFSSKFLERARSIAVPTMPHLPLDVDVAVVVASSGFIAAEWTLDDDFVAAPKTG